MNSLLGALNVALILAALLVVLRPRSDQGWEPEPIPVEIEDQPKRTRQVKR